MVATVDILGNYKNERHLLQTVHVPAIGKPFLYMKNHKAACTTVLATLMAHLARVRGEESVSLDMSDVHTPPKELLLTGPRSLALEDLDGIFEDPWFYRFTLVRDPVQRTVSAFADKLVRPGPPRHRFLRYIGRDPDADLSLSEFLDVVAQDEFARDADRHWRSQRKEISFDHIAYDFIGDVDNVAGAMKHVARAVFDSRRPLLQDTRRTLGHATSSRSLIRDMTAQDWKNIERAYAADLDMYETVKADLSRRKKGRRWATA